MAWVAAVTLALAAFLHCGSAHAQRTPPPIEGAVLDLRDWDFHRDGAVNLSGLWDAWWGRLLSPQDLRAEAIAAASTPMRLPGVWSTQSIDGRSLPGTGYATYRLRILLPATRPLLALHVDGLRTAARIYVGDVVVREMGVVGATPESARPQVRAKNLLIPQSDEIDLVIQIANFAHHDGGPSRPIKLAAKDDLETVWNKSIAVKCLLIGANLALSLYHLFYFSRRRNEIVYLVIGLCLFCIAVRLSLDNELIDIIYPGASYALLLRCEYAVGTAWALTFYCLSLTALFPYRFLHRLGAFYVFSATITTVLVFTMPTVTFTAVLRPFWALLILVAIVVLLAAIIYAVLRREPGSLATLVLMGGGTTTGALAQLLTYTNVIQYGVLADYAPAIMALFPAAIAAVKGSRNLDELAELSTSLEKLNDDLENQVRARTAELAERNAQIQRLLDNSGEGFLTFDANLTIGAQYSRACRDLLGVEPAGRDAADVFFPDDPHGARVLRETMPDILAAHDDFERDLFLSILPSDLHIGEQSLTAHYTALTDQRFMVVLRDVTEERRLAASVEAEHRLLKMIVAALTEARDVAAACDALRGFWRVLMQDAKAGAVSLADVFRTVHTFKGTFAQFCFPTLPITLHALEGRLAELAAQQIQTHDDLINILKDFDPVGALEADLREIKRTLGEDALSGGVTIPLGEHQHAELVALAHKALNADDEQQRRKWILTLAGALRELRYVNLADAIKAHERALFAVAERLEKGLKPLHIQVSGHVMVDPSIYGAWLRSLTHVMRNAVVHGLESPEARAAKNKSIEGLITCSILNHDDHVTVAITDDGAGLDLSALRRRLKMDSTRIEMTGSDFGDDQVIASIFEDQVTTRTDADDLAGRGVGLAAVKAESLSLGIAISVDTGPDRGTTFTFRLPMREGIVTRSVLPEGRVLTLGENG